ncbi:MAG: CoA transferase [Myxococcota bacterium]|nr:CoA transferase [Myxococcota bacterium]
MTAPLEGVKVVEVASYVAAPAAGALLADLGAEVVKVEVPRGEVYRYSQPRYAGLRSDFPESPQFHMDNRGKRSLALDLGRPAAREALGRVIDGADVVLTNLLPRRAVRYGLDPESLRAGRPELVVAHLSGYGPEGPDAETPSFDYAAYWARTGFMDMLREPDSPPAWQRPGIGDHAAALALVSGILAALRVRDRTGRGQTVDVNLMHIGFYVQGNDAAVVLATGQDLPRHDRRRPRNPLWSQYETADGRWLFLVMIESDRYWPALCDAIGHPELRDDPRFDGAVARYRSSEALTARLAEIFRERTLAEWEDAFAGRPLIWAPVRTLREALADPQARAMDMLRTVKHPRLEPFETVGPPLRLSGHPMPADRPGPDLGADAEAVLREAGLSEEELAAALDREPR